MKKATLIISIMIIVLCFVVFAQTLLAETPAAGDTLTGLKETATKGYDKSFDAVNKEPSVYIGQIVGAGLAFIGIIFFILIIYGGFIWMTAGGNEEKVQKAISLVIQATIGLIIVAAAYLLTKFVGDVILGQFLG